MQISNSKRSANRRNALKSTGPRTALGRKISALNSTRHGLSVALPPHINDPLQQELAQLIQGDGIASGIAHDLAQKIIDYERNVSFLWDVFESDMIDAQRVEKNKDHRKRAWQVEFENMLTDIHAKHLRGMPWEMKNMGRLTNQMNTIISQTKKDELIRSRRYFKRAANQLIKVLRQL